MKWSELFANLLGEKDGEVSSPSPTFNVQTQEISPEIPSIGTTMMTDVKSTGDSQAVQQSNGIQSSTVPNLTQEQFDALNSRIAELEKANRDLVLMGGVQQAQAQTPESIIYDLCVGRRNDYGNQNSSSNTAER